MKNLLKLHGNLTKQERVLLSIVGVLVLLGGWAVLAFVQSNIQITPIDYRAEVPANIDKTYYEDDSALVANFDRLLAMTDGELAGFGLERRRVYALLPAPSSVLASFGELYRDDKLLQNSSKSILLNFAGYFLAITISLPLGFALGLVPLVRGLFSRVFDALRFIPLTAVTGIFVIWLGLEDGMKVSFLAFGILVYLVPVVVQRIDEVENVYTTTVFTLGANSWQTIRTVYLPSVVSRLSDDVRVLTAISWTYITIAEMLNRSGGIGELIYISRRQSRIDKAFAVLLVIVLIGILQDRLFSWLDKMLFPYKYVQTKRS